MDPLDRADARVTRADARVLAQRPEAATPAQAASQFEALFVAEMLKRAQKPAFGESLLSGGSAGAMYRDMFADEVARRIAERGGFGLAREIAADVAPAASAEEKP